MKNALSPRRSRSFRSSLLLVSSSALALGLVATEGAALAQAPAPATPAAQPSAPATPAAPAAASTTPAPGPEVPAPKANWQLPELKPGGLTAEVVAQRAAETSYSAKAAQENVRAAAARVDQAWAAYLPRLTGTFKYTRLSDFTPPSFGTGSIVATPAPPGTPNPTPTIAAGFSFPLVLNNWSLEAQVVVPISDYFLRINQAYSAATKSQEAARFDVVSAKAKAATEGKLAFYNWLRARGSVVVAGTRLDDLSEGDMARWRARHIGYVFQSYNLIPVLTASENVELPLLLTHLSRQERREHVKTALRLVGLGERMDHYPRQLSGGQEQRVGLARAIVSDPTMILADEPTGNLDRESAEDILTLFGRLNRELGKTIVMVTHDPRAAERAQMIRHLEKGVLESPP